MNPIDLLTIRLEQLEKEAVYINDWNALELNIEERRQYQKAISELKTINLKEVMRMENLKLNNPIIKEKIVGLEKYLTLLCGEPIIVTAHYKPNILTPEFILSHVAETLNIDLKDMVRPDRHKGVQDANRIATVMIRDLFKLSLKKIGKTVRVGGLDHSTILARLKKHNDLIQVDKEYLRKYNLCKL